MILGSAGLKVSVTTSQLWHCGVKAATGDNGTNAGGLFQSNCIYKNRRAGGGTWFARPSSVSLEKYPFLCLSGPALPHSRTWRPSCP